MQSDVPNQLSCKMMLLGHLIYRIPFLGKLFRNWNQVDVQDHSRRKAFFSFDQTWNLCVAWQIGALLSFVPIQPKLLIILSVLCFWQYFIQVVF